MLPFLKNIQEGSASTTPDVIKRDSDTEQDYDSLHAAAEDLISAVHAKDVAGVASALRAAFEMLDEDPQQEEGT